MASVNSQEGLFLGCVTQINPHTSLSFTKNCNRNCFIGLPRVTGDICVKYAVCAEKVLVSVCWTEGRAGGAGMATTSEFHTVWFYTEHQGQIGSGRQTYLVATMSLS